MPAAGIGEKRKHYVDGFEGDGDRIMNLVIWIPALLVLGLAGLGLMFAFVFGCDKV